MDQSTLLNLVFQMRTAQKRYFNDRTNDNLIRAKNLEITVDQKLEEFFNPQKKLFS